MKFASSVAFLTLNPSFRTALPEITISKSLLLSSPTITPANKAAAMGKDLEVIYTISDPDKHNEKHSVSHSLSNLQDYPASDSHESSNQNAHKKWLKMTWEQKFALLRQFKRIFGHVNVPENLVLLGGFRLGGWLDTQRKEYQKYRRGIPSAVINAKRIVRLERVGMEWEDGSIAALFS